MDVRRGEIAINHYPSAGGVKEVLYKCRVSRMDRVLLVPGPEHEFAEFADIPQVKKPYGTE
jgi:hypothetical protein